MSNSRELSQIAAAVTVDTSKNVSIAEKITVTKDSSISGLTVGKGGGSDANSTVVGNGALAATNTVGFNTAIGSGTLASNTSGASGSALGFQAANANTTGDNNTAVGTRSLFTNTTGAANTAIGSNALRLNTTASSNTAVGYQAGYSNTTAAGITVIGNVAGYSNTTGELTAVGYFAGYSNTTGTLNTAVGVGAMYANTTGGNNVAMGRDALRLNTTASNNTAVGYQALYSNTTGANNTAVGYFALKSTAGNTARNTAVGVNALQANTSGEDNTAVGFEAGNATTTGTFNTFIGRYSGLSATTAQQNTFIGNYAGGSATGGYNTFLGSLSGYLVTSGTKNTIIGAYSGNQGGLDIRTASNYIVLSDGDGNPRGIFDNSGNFLVGKSVTTDTTVGSYIGPTGKLGLTLTTSTNSASTIDVYSTGAGTYRFYVGMGGTVYATSTTITGISDQRVKENIVDLNDGLDAVMALKPRKFDWKAGKGKDIKGDRGFIAQEFETVFPDMIEEWKDPAPEGEEPYKAVNANLIPTLVKAIQELNAKVEAQALEIATLKGTPNV